MQSQNTWKKSLILTVVLSGLWNVWSLYSFSSCFSVISRDFLDVCVLICNEEKTILKKLRAYAICMNLIHSVELKKPDTIDHLVPLHKCKDRRSKYTVLEKRTVATLWEGLGPGKHHHLSSEILVLYPHSSILPLPFLFLFTLYINGVFSVFTGMCISSHYHSRL